MARCPAHDDREPSLSIRDGDNGVVLVHCHAGCDQTQVIATLRSRGLWEESGVRGSHNPRHAALPRARRIATTPSAARSRFELWGETAPAAGTPVETYLVSRGLCLPPPLMLRFHPGLAHPSGAVWPAMVALVTSGADDAADGDPPHLSRSRRRRQSAGRSAEDDARSLPRRRRSACGTRRRADGRRRASRLAFAAMQATGHAAWAALSTSGLRTLDLPHDARDVIVLADGDDAGETAARDCARRWKREGRRVRIARPPQGMDFNDMLLGRTSHVEEDAK